jgi:hypothetical protein
LLAGWLTIASAINVLTVLTAKGAIVPTTALAAGSPSWCCSGWR